jgi:hypothetical protein
MTARRPDALGQRIAAEIGDVPCEHRADEFRERVLRFTDRKRNQGFTRLERRQ